MYRLNRKVVFKRPPMKHKKLKPINVARFKKLAIAIAIVLIAVFCYTKAQPYTQDAKATGDSLKPRPNNLRNQFKLAQRPEVSSAQINRSSSRTPKSNFRTHRNN
jgi:hypothetical protein